MTPKHSIAKRAATNICNMFDLGDHEYIKLMFGRWPFRFFVTRLEPRYRRGHGWRLRCSIAGLALDWIHRHCTVCGKKLRIAELLRREGLVHFQSGSICHSHCEPSDDYKAMMAKIKASYGSATS